MDTKIRFEIAVKDDFIYLRQFKGKKLLINHEVTKIQFRMGFYEKPKLFNALKFDFITWIKLMRNDNSN